MAFKYLDEDVIKKFITSLILPKLDFAVVIWSPHKKKDIRKIERIQRAATQMAPRMKDLLYEKKISTL